MDYITRDDEWNFVRIQNALLSILMELDRFCLQHEIEYFLVDGSALGALRHKGFIPWDDDIDIGMTADQYSKFRRLFWRYYDKNQYYLQEFGFVDGMITRAKIRKNHSYIKEDIDQYIQRDSHMGLSIDIFVFHRAPDNPILQHWQHIWGRYLRYKRAINVGFLKGNKHKVALRVLSCLPKMFLVKFALKQQYKWDKKKTEYLSSFYAEKGFKRALYKEQWFSSIIRVPFENVELPVCVGLIDYLICMYGDYNRIPTKEEIRKDLHSVEFDDSKDFHDIFTYVDCYKDDRLNL